MTILSRTQDAYGEGSVTVKTLTEAGGKEESRFFG